MFHNADLVDDFTKIPYYKLPGHESWRIQIIQEISETKTGKTEIANFTKEECFIWSIVLIPMVLMLFVFG